ncbi:Ig-like domain-containing protein [Glaciibacter superstes]|uniref:Ig-like domain-containing protein n=1 Tax=Glaciibacter superstes TaxID=501023 RepID=UPI0003B530F6|nr:Ig-like domain-containing protein [Glaciibacter superstes]
MIRQWFRAHRSGFITATSVSAVVAVVASVALTSGGYTAQRVDLGDAAVWVTNEVRQVLGRANTEVNELNTVVAAGSTALDVVQDGHSVVVIDRGNSAIDIIDPATAEIAASVPLPPDDPAVMLADDRAVIASDGNVWTLPVQQLETFDSASEPDLSLGSGSVASLGATGIYSSFTPSTGILSRFDTGEGDTVSDTTDVKAGSADDEYQLSSTGDDWVLLNVTTGMLYYPGGDQDVSGLIGPGSDPVLQQPSSVVGHVLIAHRGGLVDVSLSGSPPEVIVSDRDGEPAAPVVLEKCSYAAWTDAGAWRSCRGAESSSDVATLDSVAGDARLEFRVNGEALVLNDAHTGDAWAVQQNNQLIDNWAELIDADQDEEQVEENRDDIPPELEKAQQPPVAEADEFGARPGRSTVLPVLLNDYDANNDVLGIAGTDALPAEQGSLEVVGDGQQLQLKLPASASGIVSFTYTITDGRGGEATATVAVTVRGDDENSPPAQARATHASVQSDGRVDTDVLGDWVDPDGDPYYLASAAASGADQVVYTPEGSVVFTDMGAAEEERHVGLVVSDGTDIGSGSLVVTVRPAGSVPIIAESFLATATAGTEVTVSPLEHAHGGSAPLKLSSVPSKPDVTIAPNFNQGTFRFLAPAPGVYYVEYAVTDGEATAAGQVRVDVAPVPDANSTPITVPHTAFVRGQRATLVDVLATDFDPAGGVLLVTGTTDVSAAGGIRVEILDQRLIRVTLTRPLETGTTSFGYRVSNGFAEADGIVTLIEIPERPESQAPIATADTVTVRMGDAIDIPVLANDEHPDGEALSLHSTLTTEPEPGSGLLFTSGTVLRYLAPDKPGNFTAVYRVDAPDGQFASAQVQISVREIDAASNNPPAPKAVTARVLAGEKVRIPIPLAGIDPDGDSVKLLGQETNPEKGAVTEVGTDSITYQPGEYSAGTDSFTYTVIDGLGARASGTVRVGISPRQDGARNPVAAPDEVLARPGGTVWVRVLGNDSDPDGGELVVTEVEAAGSDGSASDGTASVDGDAVKVSVPKTEGRYGFIYEIQNERGGTSSNFLTVVASADAPLARPDAHDTVLGLSDILDRKTIDVDVLANVFFADGPSSSLELSVLPGYRERASITAAGRVRVTIADESQIVPFAVSHPDDASVVSYAFIWVPGFDDALPQLKKDAKDLRIPSGSTLTIAVNDFVVAASGKKVRLTDASIVRATHADGTSLVKDAGTLVFASADKYFGPASISFEVTDGASADAKDARTATIVLPIEVTPRDNQPPAFGGALIEVQPDGERVLDLVKLTTYPYPDDLAALRYQVLEPKPEGFTWSLDGQKLTIKAVAGTRKGSQSALTIGVSDDAGDGRAGRIDLRVVASTRPLAVPAADTAIAPRGQSTPVDVLANDGATNPFPAVPLSVVAVRGLDSASLPAGVAITPSADNSTLSVRVADDAPAVDTNLQYQVADATGDPDRYAWGTVRISVQDKPDPVTGLRMTGFGDGTLTLAFNPGAYNNSPISGYEVTLRGMSGNPVGTTVCQSTTCTITTRGNGQDNAVTVSVAARNAIGLSAPTTLGSPVWSDVVPAAPTGMKAAPLDGALRVSWDTVAVAGAGTAVRRYQVIVNGAEQQVAASGPSCTAASCSIDVGGLSNGTEVPVSVTPMNDAYPALAAWNHADANGIPYGAPRAARIWADSNAGDGTVTVSWDRFDPNGNAVGGYYVQRLSSGQVPTGPQACAVGTPAPGTVKAPTIGGAVEEQATVSGDTTSYKFTNLTTTGATYYFVVWGYNGAACVNSPVTERVVLRPAPGPVEGVEGSMANRGQAWDYQVTGVSGGFSSYRIRKVADTGDGAQFSGSGWPREILGLPFGAAAQFQLRGCTFWGSCGDWTTFTADEASVDLTVTGVAYDPATGVVSWTNGPANPGMVADYRCFALDAPDAVGTAVDGATTCTVPGPYPTTGTVRLSVTVDGQSFDYDK